MKIFQVVFILLLLAVAAPTLRAQTANLQANKDLVTKFYETFGTRHDVEGCLPFFDRASFRLSMDGMPDTDLEGYKQLGILYLKAFPDLNITVLRIVAEGDQVAVYSRFTGTHQGDLMGIPPTNKKVDVLGADFWTLRNGKIVGLQSLNDNMTMMQQLGVIPAK